MAAVNTGRIKAYEGPAVIVQDEQTFIVTARVYRSNALRPEFDGLPQVCAPPSFDWTVEACADSHVLTVRFASLIRFPHGHEGKVIVTDGRPDDAGGHNYDLKGLERFPSHRDDGLVSVCRQCAVLLLRGAGDTWVHIPQPRQDAPLGPVEQTCDDPRPAVGWRP
jgi:hypothetical protein